MKQTLNKKCLLDQLAYDYDVNISDLRFFPLLRQYALMDIFTKYHNCYSSCELLKAALYLCTGEER